jgi:sugar lactone lactonase YvrE
VQLTFLLHFLLFQLNLPDTVQMTNGGTGPYNGSLLLVTNGLGPLPPSVVLVNPKSPNNATVLLDNFFGRQFDSLDDVKVHPSGKIFFTDVSCVISLIFSTCYSSVKLPILFC